MRTALLPAAVALVLTAACGGPQRPVDVGFRQVPSDVLLGGSPTPSAVAPSAPPLPLPVIPPPSVVSLPPPPPFSPSPVAVATTPPAVVPSPTGCPALDPLAAPRLEATPSIDAPPVPASYAFTNAGTFAVSGAEPRSGVFPERTLRTYGALTRPSSGTFTYDVAETIGDTTTTTTYRVVTDASLPSETNGLYLVRMTYARADGTTASFDPVPAPQVVALPLIRGATSDQRAVDPRTQTTMSFTTTVEGKARVAACGEPLDTWTVHLSQGTLRSPNQDLQFDATYQLATQYGGIVVGDAVAFTGTDSGAGVQRSNTATISVPPRVPKP